MKQDKEAMEAKLYYCGAGIYHIEQGNDTWAVPASELMPAREGHEIMHIHGENERFSPLFPKFPRVKIEDAQPYRNSKSFKQIVQRLEVENIVDAKLW